jgi:hypothetical protein
MNKTIIYFMLLLEKEEQIWLSRCGKRLQAEWPVFSSWRGIFLSSTESRQVLGSPNVLENEY